MARSSRPGPVTGVRDSNKARNSLLFFEASKVIWCSTVSPYTLTAKRCLSDRRNLVAINCKNSFCDANTFSGPTAFSRKDTSVVTSQDGPPGPEEGKPEYKFKASYTTGIFWYRKHLGFQEKSKRESKINYLRCIIVIIIIIMSNLNRNQKHFCQSYVTLREGGH